MQRRIRRQRRRRCCRGSERARTVLEFGPDVLLAKIEEFGQCLLGIRVRHAFDELVNGTDCIGSHIVARIVKDHVEDHVVKVIRKVNADLAASARDRIDNLD